MATTSPKAAATLTTMISSTTVLASGETAIHRRVPNSTVLNGRDATLVGLMVRKAVHENRVVTMSEILGG